MRGSSASNDMIPPTPRPPPAFTCAEPGPWQFSQANLPGCVMLMRPIRVFLNSAVWLAWQVRQTLSPTKWASTGALVLFALRRRAFAPAWRPERAPSWVAQRVHQTVRFGQFRLALDRFRLAGADALREVPQRRIGLVVELAVGTFGAGR